MRAWLGVVDSYGVYGNYLHFALVICLVGSAFLIFIYLWTKGRLDMDEEPKIQMMQDEDEPKEGEDNEPTRRR